MDYEFFAELWIYNGQGAWHFVTLPLEIAVDIAEIAPNTKRGFGSVRVLATIGNTTWATSLFKDSKSGSYILPVKKDVRSNENIASGSDVRIAIKLV
jgi:hypothetical protein